MLQIPVSQNGSLKDCHFFTTGSGSASGQQYQIDTYCSPPLLHLRLIKFGQISHGKKLNGEQKQVVAHNTDCGAALRWEFDAFGRGAYPEKKKKRVFMGDCGGERIEEGKRGERRGRSGAVTEDRGSHSKKMNIK